MPYEREPRTLGQHLRKRRLELGLKQIGLRVRFKLDKETYANWENDRCFPATKHWPKALAFLGYDPMPATQTLGAKLLAFRRQSGMSRKALANLIGADEATVWRWESGEREPKSTSHMLAVTTLLRESK